MINKFDLQNTLDLFKEELQLALIFHIPHSSSFIPSLKHFNTQYVKDEVNLLTDWKVDEIFNIDEIKKVIANFSRLYCDVERLPDEDEPMFQKGAGFYYTKTDDGKLLRTLNEADKRFVYDNFYLKHHALLESMTRKTIEECGYVDIIDCHSFSTFPLKREFNQDINRPDICLGVDRFHTPEAMWKEFSSFFNAQGLSVSINMPYEGTIVPLSLYQKDKRVKSIMIEINKRLYMNEETLEFYPEKIKQLNQMMKTLFL